MYREIHYKNPKSKDMQYKISKVMHKKSKMYKRD